MTVKYNTRVPASFAFENANFSWHDIKYGMDNNYCDKALAVKLAASVIEVNESYPDIINELAWSDSFDEIYECVCKLTSCCENIDESAVKKKWLYVLLYWIYIHRSNFDNPLEIVNYIYADFEYPESIESFISYMPSNDVCLGSIELNKERLFNRWKLFLKKQGKIYKKK